MTNKLRSRKLLVFLLVSTFFFAFSDLYVLEARAVSDFADSISFEFGAELGVLDPPWDVVGPYPGSSEGRGDVEVSTTHVRSGTNSVWFWQEDGTSNAKNDADRRIELREYSSIDQKDYYISWWVYFDTWNDADDNDRTTLGGFQTFFGPSDDRWRWWTNARFAVHSGNDHYLQFAYGMGSTASWWDGPKYPTDAISDALSSSDYIYVGGNPVSLLDYLDQWVHLQIHVKWATDATGEVQAWFNNNLVYSQTDFISDPSGYSQWNSYGNLWGYNTPYPIVTIEHYGPKDAINQEFWVDDIVAATEKVPEDYRVGDR